MEAQVFEKALALYGITEPQMVERLSGGTYNAVFEFDQRDERFVIRIGELEFDVETTNGMIAWLQYLGENRAAVPKLVKSVQNNPVEYFQKEDRTYSVDVSVKILGENARQRVLQNQDMSWAKTFGQPVGKIHQLERLIPWRKFCTSDHTGIKLGMISIPRGTFPRRECDPAQKNSPPGANSVFTENAKCLRVSSSGFTLGEYPTAC